MDRIYRWATKTRARNNATIASITSGDYIHIGRCDLRSMGSRKQTMMLTDENIEACKGPKKGFFPVISQKLGEGKNWYNAEIARKREYWLFPVCKNEHWWLYVLHRRTENLWVLDSMYTEPDSEYRKSIDNYVGVLLKDLAAFVDDTGPFNGDGFDCGYEQVNGKQPNTWDCGVYVLKWMQMWDPKSLGDEAPPLPH
ncbi:hypothetical protein PIB30_085855 [Stylosanthes scabra]|uniref:Ubiquitin-like protease family profile domain-containing protein n=1 Tax=Stylosanthes scabra TaxID=79078 RepID=A0ABU6RTE0_9FABA|nr:hypothetical protein [Stylosanthes scabra]